MMSSNQYQAAAFLVSTAKGGKRTVRKFSHYPTVPAHHPNRAVRRLARKGRVDLMPTAWRTFFTNLNLGRR